MAIDLLEIANLSKEDLTNRFDTNEKCKEYIAEKKWEKGFICSKCNKNDFWKHQDPFSRVCKSCRHIESCTANTFFHKIKFPLPIAFHLLNEVWNSKKSETVRSISRKFEINHKTAGLYIDKIKLVKSKNKRKQTNAKIKVTS